MVLLIPDTTFNSSLAICKFRTGYVTVQSTPGSVLEHITSKSSLPSWRWCLQMRCFTEASEVQRAYLICLQSHPRVRELTFSFVADLCCFPSLVSPVNTSSNLSVQPLAEDQVTALWNIYMALKQNVGVTGFCTESGVSTTDGLIPLLSLASLPLPPKGQVLFHEDPHIAIRMS